jgi:type VI secretion system protein ImpH
METEDRNQRNSVIDLLFKESYRFDFYQAVRLLEILYRRALFEKGEDAYKLQEEDFFDPANFPVQFRSTVGSVFPASDVEKISLSDNKSEIFEMMVNFIGIAGIQGPLPYHYTQLIMDTERESSGNKAFREFLDIFNHRLISLMYQIRKVHRVTFDLCPPEDTLIAKYLFSLIGVATDGLKNRLSVQDRTLLYYTGLFTAHSRSLSGIEYILSDYFRVKIQAVSFVGAWQVIPADQRIKIGAAGVSQILGVSATIGKCFWDPAAKFELRIGPVSGGQFLDFLPLKSSKSFAILYELTKHYAGSEYSFDFILIVNPAHLTPVKLGDKITARLGWTAWIPQKIGSIYDYENLHYIQSDKEVKSTLSNGERVRLGWTVWVPDSTTGKECIEVRLSSNQCH